MKAHPSSKETANLIEVSGVGLSLDTSLWSFVLRRSEAVWIPVHADSKLDWLSYLTGIAEPAKGSVRWKGEDWRSYNPDQAASMRGRIGCVFSEGGLIVNLDMDENVWLPSRVHRREAADQDIERWARHFQCWPLPQVRAPSVSDSLRKRLLLTRASCGRPELLILEHPLLGLSSEDCLMVFDALATLRASGCAVVWLDDLLDQEVVNALEPYSKIEPHLKN